MSDPVVKLPFRGCALTAYGPDGHGTEVTLDVTDFAEFLRGEDGTCAFCHGDPCAERPCPDCGGGYIKILKPGELPAGGLPVRTFTAARWSFQHIPHGEDCTRVTWIDREFAATPEYSRFETCPCCQGRPT
jgi:hypothetical protein